MVRVRIEFEVPQWTRWVAVGLSVGIAIGYGVAVVRAESASLVTWNSGDTLTADQLNGNFASLQATINAQQAALLALSSPDCPFGYSRNSSVTGFIVCSKGSDEVVKIGNGGSAFWIDRYEASIWEQPDGTGAQFGLASPNEFPSGFPKNGQYSTPLYALSKKDTQPAAYLTWFQAVAACEASGKQLPTGQQWIRAARNTMDPGSSDGKNGDCNTGGSKVRNTGAASRCVSAWGAEDMVGNLWEMTAEWNAGSTPTDDAPWNVLPWSESAYNGDGLWNIGSVVFELENSASTTHGIPGFAMRGGSSFGGTLAGVFALSYSFAPANFAGENGFRCVLSR